MAQDLYRVLGVDRTAEHAAIKRAYRAAARKFHPDHNPGDDEAESKFKEAAEAWRVLGDEELRAEYDGRTDGGSGDFFDEFFGNKRPRKTKKKRTPVSQPREESRTRRRGPERGSDLRYMMELNFEDAALGTNERIEVPKRDRCGACAGTGARPGSTPMICKTCGGTGTERNQKGFFDVSERCSQCNGKGKLFADGCDSCGGTGSVLVKRPLTVKVPAGVTDGTRLKLAGEGEVGSAGGEPGDLIVVVTIKAHPFFEREESDILVDAPVNFTDAALGSQVEIPTLEGKVRIRIPPGSQSGRVFRLKGKGIPSLDGRGRGDQRVRIVVETPTFLTDQQRALLEEYAAIEGNNAEPSRVEEYRNLLRSRYRSS